MKNKIKYIGWIVVILLILVVAGFIYSSFFKPTYGENNFLSFLIAGLIIGGVISYLILKLYAVNRKEQRITESSHIIVESMRKVFKIVCAEGQFHEIYDFEETKKILKIIPSTKRALVIVKAKVLIGYDFEKCVWEKDDQNRKIKIVSFPEPEILSMEPDFKYYHFDDDIFNVISKEDLQRIQEAGKKQVMEAALKSDLKKIAALQMQTMLSEVLGANKWGIDNIEKIDYSPTLSIEEKHKSLNSK